jgi:hypothetical protein
VISVLPVPPLCVRPSVDMGDAKTSHDDLTFQLGEVIKANTALQTDATNSAPPHVVREHKRLLQIHVACLFDNSLPRTPQALQVRVHVHVCVCVCVCVCVEVAMDLPILSSIPFLCVPSLTRAAVWAADQGHRAAAQGQGRPCAWQPDGQARRLLRPHCHHARPEPLHRPGTSP